MPKIVFTGGHHNSALSVVREIINQNIAEVVWFGHKYTMLGDRKPSAEYVEVTKSGIRFIELNAGKLYKTIHPIHLMRIPWGFIQAYWYLLREQPDLIVSFGGYLAAPVVFAGWLQGIPTVTHEQTTVVGLANKFIAQFATKIFVAWPQSKKYFQGKDVTLSGLPLREAIFRYTPELRWFDNELPTIYITGGKQGSHVINETVADALPELLKRANVIHQCGSNTLYNDFEKLEKRRSKLGPDLQNRYIVRQYIYEDEIGQVFHQAGLIIARAGAHTVYEIAALAKPAIFIPIPWVSHNEQYKNARILVNAGSATILPEDDLSSRSLIQEIDRVFKSLKTYQVNAEKAKDNIIFDGKQRIVNAIAQILQEQAVKK